ncbi:Protein C21orf2 [Strigomonas culicis]|uniref:Protein C21orf2 n=1 Tax=Strigomonas culicis TaxID=28005 RepID=S9U750_9TRYP|nr:Protein C21orf2 [Strigomonas culicis]|eukprot:EPY26567.1 Protein C21orf2 [Strigomonas culicis]
MTTLTMAMVLDKTKVDSADHVRHLNLWGEQLTDVSVVQQLKHLEVLALATNKISSLKPFAACEGLQELYLRKNAVASLLEVTSLTGLKKLGTLWLMDNPCAKHPYYRDFVLHCCPYLKQLDNAPVTPEERAEAARRLSPKVLDGILGRTPAPPATPPKSPATPLVQPRALSGSAAPSAQNSPPTSNGPPRARKSSSAQPTAPPRAAASPSAGSTPVDSDGVGLAADSPAAVLVTTVPAQRAMLLSIVSLLPELTAESLEMLRKEVQEQLERQRERPVRLITNSPSH